MKFIYQQVDHLPKLAWCASLEKENPTIAIRHGPGVETRADCCFEGAWNGAFAAGRFDEADTFTGTGVRLTATGALFVTPTHPIENLYLVRNGDRLLVSNSWVFLLVQIDDQPALHHATYFFDLRHHYRYRKRTPTKLPTQKGYQLYIYTERNFEVTSGLQIRQFEKNYPAKPNTYATFVQLLQTTVKQMIENAADPTRRQAYRPVSMISTGYDSTAVAALLAQAGGREAVTFAWHQAGEETDDDGSKIAEMLGMRAQRFVRFAYTERTDLPEAEFCTTGPNSWAPLSVMEETLAGSLLGIGIMGYVWQAEMFITTPSLGSMHQQPSPYRSITEFRLRVGFYLFPVLQIGALHGEATRRIVQSQAMQPWVLPNRTYNRPIQRRIVEEAGVPRSMFGQQKHASAFAVAALEHHFSITSRKDFISFCRRNGLPTAEDNSRIVKLIRRISSKVARSSTKLFDRLPKRLYVSLLPYTWWLYARTCHPLWRSPSLYTVHWGFDRIKGRYTINQELP